MSLIRVRCLECKAEHYIEMKHIGTEKKQRSLGFEYEHIFKGKLKCSDCGEKMKLLTTIFEYPKGFSNYHETINKSCVVMDDFPDDALNVLYGYTEYSNLMLEKNKSDMNEIELRQMFKNNSDCYADTGRFENDGSYTDGDVIQAMTEDRFIEVLRNLQRTLKTAIID